MLRLLLILVWFLLYIVVFLPVLIVLLIWRIFDRKSCESAARACVKLLIRLVMWTSGAKITVKGLENIPQGEPVLFVPNHRSYFDFVITYCKIPGIYYVGKKELAYPPIIGQWVWLIGTLLMNRKSKKEGYKTIEEAARLMKEEQKSILIFPEGTRNKGKQEEPLRFREGSLKISTWSGFKVVPIALMGTRDIYENHRPFVRPADVKVIIGTPIDPAALSEEERKAFGALTRERIIQMMKEEEKNHG